MSSSDCAKEPEASPSIDGACPEEASPCETPVAVFVYRRPQLTKLVMEAISRVRPRTLLVVADAPHEGDLEETRLCEAARSIAVAPSWPCRLLTNLADVHLGCRRRMSTGLDWVFSVCEEAIVLEDDCLPSTQFFEFCDLLLAAYRDDPRVMAIAGSGFTQAQSADSYYFSATPCIWGWATWRRAWSHYDVDAKAWQSLRETDWLRRRLGAKAGAFWASAFDHAALHHADTWDYQWVLACLLQGGLTATPFANLVQNLGWGSDATHTKMESSPITQRKAERLTYPLRHPPEVGENAAIDEEVLERLLRWLHPAPGFVATMSRLHNRLGRLFLSPKAQR